MKYRTFADDILAQALRMERGEDLGGAEIARILKRLTELEVEEGGPYGPVIGGVLDLGMNLAVARFLRACDVRLPKLDAFIEASLANIPPSSRVFDSELLEKMIEEHMNAPKAKKEKPITFDVEEQKVMDVIRRSAQQRFNGLSKELQTNAADVMERTIRGNPDKQMSLMALYTRQALGAKGEKFSDDHVGKLGLANIFFWTAFIIYDDFWDEDEAAEPKILPAANLFARHYTDFFSNLLPAKTGFRDFFHETMDALDGANSWETVACRGRVSDGIFIIPESLPAYGDFSIKFHPAGGQVLGPVSILIEIGYAADSPEIKHFVDYFRHYLVAMQLNDDMHDWKEDLARGHISTAVFVLLQKWLQKYPNRREIDLEKDMSALEQIFWFEALKPLCDAALEHVSRSRKALEAVKIFENPAPLVRFITRNERAVHEALAEYGRSRDFLRAFS